MKNREWVVIIAVVLVVAVAVSLITANITGNVIVKKSPFGTAGVYTAAEIDQKLTAMDIKFSDSNNVGTALNKRIYPISQESASASTLIAYCKDLNDIPLSGYCKTANNKAVGNHGILIYGDLINIGGFACSNVGSLISDMKTTVYCLDVDNNF